MKMPIKKTLRQIQRSFKRHQLPSFSSKSATRHPFYCRPGFMLFAISFALFCLAYTVCSADLTATPSEKGIIELTWAGGASDVYRDTSILKGLDDITGKLWESAATTGWEDGKDKDHPTTDGTKYYYAVNTGGTFYYADAIADKTPPSVENATALTSPFSPDGDRIEDITSIFFTLTETTYVTLNIYFPDVTAPEDETKFTLVRTLLDGMNDDGDPEALSPGDHFVEWDGTDDAGAMVADDGRYIYRFEVSDPADADDELLEDKDPPKNSDGDPLPRTRDMAGNILLQNISGDIWIHRILYELRDVSVTPTPFSPNGDKVRDVTNISYVLVDPDNPSEFSTDYVTGNIRVVEGGQQTIVATVYAECLDYYWSYANVTWTAFHVVDGIRAGLSSEKYYLRPVNSTYPPDDGPGGGEPPFHVSSPYPAGLETIDDYLAYRATLLPGDPEYTNYWNWAPVSFSISWNGEGATSASTYIVGLEAVKSNGAKTLQKTHGIVIENPTIVPNDKAPPIVEFTFPMAGSVYTAQLEYVQVYLNDGQGAGTDLAKSTIFLLGPAGEMIPGKQSNDGSAVLTWRLHEALVADGSADGTYTIVVSTVDFAKNSSSNIRFEFEYNTSINDDVLPGVVDLPLALDDNGDEITEISDDGTTIIEESIGALRVKICDYGSGMDLNASQIELVKIVGILEVHISAEKNSIPETPDCGYLLLQLSTALLTTGEDDGLYKLKVDSVDIAGNIASEEFSFTYKTVVDTDAPYVTSMRLLGESGEIIVENDGPAPFHLGQVSGPIAAVSASVFDDSLSAGLRFEVENSYMVLDGPGIISGEIQYTQRGRTESGDAFANIVFVLPEGEPLSVDGEYTATVMVEDIAGNKSEEAVCTFEYVRDSFVVEDVNPPLINDVAVLSPTVQNIGPICLDKYPYVNDATGIQVALFDEGSGVDAELSFIELIEPNIWWLFSIDSSIQSDLDSGDIPAALRDAFEDSGNPLSDDVDKIILLIEEENRGWLINDVDKNRMYTIRKEFSESGGGLTDELNVYIRYTINGELTADTSQGISALNLSLNWPVALSIRGWYTLNVFAVDNTQRSLFSIDLEDFQDEHGTDLVAELDYSMVSEDLRDGTYGFTDNEILLSKNTIVSVRDRGRLWLVTDQGQGELNVYGAGGCRWRRLDDQKTYIVEKKVWKEGDDLKSRLDISESNTTMVQILDALFFDDAPPKIAPIQIYNDETLLPSAGITVFNNIRATIQESDSGIDYAATGIVLTDDSGTVIPGSLQIDKDAKTVTWLLKSGQSLTSGSYTVEVRTRDMAGNSVSASMDFRAVLAAEEPQAPSVVSVSPEDGAIINGIVEQVSAVLRDNSGTGINYELSYIDVDAPPGVPRLWDIEGHQESDEANQIIIWDFSQSLPTDGRGDGEYDVYVRAYDNEGRKSEKVHTVFTYDSQPPVVKTVELGSRPWISLSHEPISGLRAGGTNRQLSTVVVKLEDRFSDIDLISSKVTIEGVTVDQTNDGINTIVVDFPQFSTDGEDDGAYQISITAVDVLGNANAFPYTYTFIYDTQPPQLACAQACIGDESVTEVLAISPENDAPTPIFGNCLLSEPGQETLILSKLDKIKVKLTDGSLGVGIDLPASADNIFIYGPHGQIAGKRDVEGDDTVVFKFDTPLSATDSTDDGTYTVKTNAVDKVGNQIPVEFSFEYRAMAPLVTDVQVVTDGDEVFSFAQEEYKQLERSVIEIRVILEDRSGKGINFDQTIVDVDGPGTSIQDVVTNNGVDTVIYTLAEPLANDGTDDGLYLIYIRAVDNDGHWEQYNWWFTYDTTSPEVVSTIPADGAVISEPISQVSATLSDALTPLDLFDSTISLGGPASMSVVQVNDGVDTIELMFLPLADNGTEDGLYEISVDPRDILGNEPIEPFTFTFIYDTTAPDLASTEPSVGEMVTIPLERVVAVLSDGNADETAGIDLNSCSLTLIKPDGTAMVGELQREEPDILAFIPGVPMTVDGTDDGTYTIIVAMQDLAGNVSTPALVSFTYTTISPSVSWTTPVNGAQIRIPVSSVSAILVDNSGAGLNLEASMLTLTGPDGEAVSGTFSFIEPNTIVYTLDNLLATDGNDDGIYTLNILAVDNTAISASYTTTFLYDRTPATVKSASPADGDVLNDDLDSVWAQLEDIHSGIDLGSSTLILTGPGGNVPGVQVNDGVDTIKYNFAPLSSTPGADGQYTISVTPVDRVGNVPPEPQNFSFIYDTTAPIVRKTNPAEGETIVVALDMVSAHLDDALGAGVDLAGSRIHLRGPDGQDVVGVETNNSIDALMLTFPPLAVDGTDDGEYTIVIVAQDLAGNVNTESIAFEYKTLAPALVDIQVVTDGDEVLSFMSDDYRQFTRSVIEVRVILEDKSGKGINFDQTILSVDGPGASAQDVIINNDIDTLIYVFDEPLANNGTDDGNYIIAIKAVDNDGHFMEYFGWFIYDTTSPEVVSTIPADGSIISEPISQVSATLSDVLTPVDLFDSTISLSGTASMSMVQVNDGVDTIELVFLPLASDGTEDGLYEISVDPRDALDNEPIEPFTFTFIYDTTAPALVLTEPSVGKVVTTPLERVVAILSDGDAKKTAGVDLSACSLELLGPSGEIVAGELTRTEPDTLTLELNASSDGNGPVDGDYTIRVTAQDIVGNMSGPILVNFTHVTRSPAVLSTVPANGAKFKVPIGSVSATLADNSGAGLDLDKSRITLIGPDGSLVSGTQGIIEPNTVNLLLDKMLATDNTDDGIYTLDILVVDKTGVSVSYTSAFIFDTVPPVVMVTTPADGAIMNSASFNVGYVSAQIEDAHSGIDLGGSTISLTGPDGGVLGTQVNDGVDTIKYTFEPFSSASNSDGQYTISVIPVDMVGNVPLEPLYFSFIYDTTPPVVKDIWPDLDSTVVIALDRVSVQLEDDIGAGVDLEGSRIQLSDPTGNLVPGVRNDEDEKLVLTFPALAINGDDNGEYTITVVTQDKLGNTSEDKKFRFSYLPTAPNVVMLSPEDSSFISTPVERIEIRVEDKSGTGIDFGSSWIKLIHPGGQEVEGQMSNDESSLLRLNLQNPLATNGMDDGKYAVDVKAVDNEGNAATYSLEFSYDTTPCTISAVHIANAGEGETPVEPTDLLIVPSDFGIITRVTAEIHDQLSGVDLNLSGMSLLGPDGNQISAVLKNDGVNIIILELDMVAVDGVYTVIVTPVDKLKNAIPQGESYTFMVDTTAPAVSASTPPDDSMVVNRKLEEVSVQLDDDDGSGIDEGALQIQVMGPNGEISGSLSAEWEGETPGEPKYTLRYAFDTPLSMDGHADGGYVINVWFADKAGNQPDPISLSFTYDTIQPGGPDINNVGVFPKAFSPNDDGTYDSATISYLLSKDANVSLSIYSFDGALVRTLLDSEPGLAGMNSVVWDGMVGDGAERHLTSDGMYQIKIDAIDDRGLTGAMESSTVELDTRPPSVDLPTISDNPFTPDGDGFADSTTIGFVVSGSESYDSVAVAIYNPSLEKIASPGLDRRFAGDGNYRAVWYGEGANVDGEYSFVITARDAAGNIKEISGTIGLDKSPPIIQVLTPESYVLYTNELPIVLSGTAIDWSGVRSVSLVGLFTPAGSSKPMGDPRITNWVEMMFSGDKVDNDWDGRIDEEKFNNLDDDGDGLIDEDLAAEAVAGAKLEFVNWMHRLEPETDGEYAIRFRSSDSINHTIIPPEVLKVVYDSVPPLHVRTTGESLSSEDASGGAVAGDSQRVSNGSIVTIVTTWDEPGYKVTVDLSQLDSGFAVDESLEAKDKGDGKYTVEYEISEGNTQSDGMKTILITAEDVTGNRTVLDTFEMKLRNDLPTIVSLSSPDGRTSYANGALVKVLVECDDSDLSVLADFTELDSTYASGNVKVTNKGDNTYLVEYTIGIGNTVADAPNIPINIQISDGMESVSAQYEVALDNADPQMLALYVNQTETVPVGIDKKFSSAITFADGGTVELQALLDGPGYDISVDFSYMDSTYKPGNETVVGPREGAISYMYTISYKLGSANNMPDSGNYTVVIEAVDAAGNASQYVLLVGLDNTAPVILSVTSMDEDTIYKNGDTVMLLVKLDGANHAVSADFSQLDSTYLARAKEVSISDNGDGTYTVKYTISKDNIRGLSDVISDVRITMTAVDQVGNTSTDFGMMVELDNIPPKLEIDTPESDTLVDVAWIEIKGRTESGVTVKVKPEPSSSSLDNSGSFSYSVALDVGDNVVTITATDVAGNETTETFTISYRPSISAAQGGTVHLPENRDDGIEGNDTKVVIPPGAARQDFSIEITQLEGAPLAVDNPNIGRGAISPLIAYEFVLKDAAGNGALSMIFTQPIELYLQYQDMDKLTGPAVVFRWDGVRWNRIGGQEDRERNIIRITVNSLSIFGVFEGTDVPTEFRLEGAFPNPFTPNSDGINDIVSFYFNDPNGSEALVRIFDLRGALVRRLEDGLTSWDGLDDAGEPVEMGAYVFQIEMDGKFEGGAIILAR